ncbi:MULTISPECIES: hypothetical protein [Streptomyces]|uniref:Multisubunit Na+/H+ antiporter MnhE subunit n=1 Tax=Streptomyces demainii TaxID=588122 RepID=A0ABT9L2J4_9ACTN|nr:MULTISPECIES: hypothetical protein [Streptomyces]MBW8089795.1 hypothetical protein [Streptomyces hygroscopicus subsp. hygroscopicus]MCO8306732.1 hypothetical protein [Streptomyces sp. RKCA744]MDP9614839.1 multisubunit Na+/H+ antiporter MnhE subunit [Streptomyces demainii]
MAAVLEVLVWWSALTGIWLVLISTVDPLEVLVGAVAALAAALLARAGRRAVAAQ